MKCFYISQLSPTRPSESEQLTSSFVGNITEPHCQRCKNECMVVLHPTLEKAEARYGMRHSAELHGARTWRILSQGACSIEIVTRTTCRRELGRKEKKCKPACLLKFITYLLASVEEVGTQYQCKLLRRVVLWNKCKLIPQTEKLECRSSCTALFLAKT